MATKNSIHCYCSIAFWMVMAANHHADDDDDDRSKINANLLLYTQNIKYSNGVSLYRVCIIMLNELPWSMD